MFSVASASSGDIFWSFDGHANDFYNQYNGVLQGGATYISPGYNGRGSALALSGNRSQCVLVSKYKDMTYTSFTWEMWVYSECTGR